MGWWAWPWSAPKRLPAPFGPQAVHPKTGATVLNLVVVIGTLGKPPQVRSLPSGFGLASFDLQVARSETAFELVPVAFFDPSEGVSALEAGEQVLVVGRVRRRFFRVGGSTQSRTEVVAERVVALSRAEEAKAALGHAAQLLGTAMDDAQVPRPV